MTESGSGSGNEIRQLKLMIELERSIEVQMKMASVYTDTSETRKPRLVLPSLPKKPKQIFPPEQYWHFLPVTIAFLSALMILYLLLILVVFFVEKHLDLYPWGLLALFGGISLGCVFWAKHLIDQYRKQQVEAKNEYLRQLEDYRRVLPQTQAEIRRRKEAYNGAYSEWKRLENTNRRRLNALRKEEGELLRLLAADQWPEKEMRNLIELTTALMYLETGRCNTCFGKDGAFALIQREVDMEKMVTWIPYHISNPELMKENFPRLYDITVECKKEAVPVLDEFRALTAPPQNVLELPATKAYFAAREARKKQILEELP